MINTTQTYKTVCSWISIVYVICFGGVALMPNIRSWFMKYALHTEINTGVNVITPTIFVIGLIIWNITAVLAICISVINNYFKNNY